MDGKTSFETYKLSLNPLDKNKNNKNKKSNPFIPNNTSYNLIKNKIFYENKNKYQKNKPGK